MRSTHALRLFLALPLLVSALVTALNTGSFAAESATGTALFDGKDLAGWRQPRGDWSIVGVVRLDSSNNKFFTTETGAGVLLNHPTGHTVNLLSESEHADVEAHVEFVVPKGSNSGVYFMGRYEVQILDSWEVKQPKYGDCGGIYASCSEPKPDFPGRAPNVNASKPPGEWQTFDVVFRAPRFDASGNKIENARFIKVTHNGRVVHENVEVPRPTCAAHWLGEKPLGPLMLQGDHGPVAYRNLWIRKVKLK